jgi:hypothetical protein
MTNWAVLGSMNGADIEAMAFLVLMQAAKSAQEDLKAIMDPVKATNEAKEKLRGLLQKLKEKQPFRATCHGRQPFTSHLNDRSCVYSLPWRSLLVPTADMINQ